ncbi:hypothetical protein GALL_64740 [mine drainage metagenome]|uniref:Sialate O-acetylesterase domain-containing protein n=1 Tax=mine drainage metagenome TaxID=410659 RepID=A0A1J5T7C8_9ZZZZ
MVLQREKPIHIWGKGIPNKNVIITFSNQSKNTEVGYDSVWSIYFSKQKANAQPQTISVISGNERIEVSNILFGDVWFASGQSNMEFVVGKNIYGSLTNKDSVIASANYPLLRFNSVKKYQSLLPLDTIKVIWTVCSPKTVSSFSAVAYFFAKKLQSDLQIPIGIIVSSIGGTKIEAWTPLEGLKNAPEFSAALHLKDTATKLPSNYYQLKNFPSSNYNTMVAPYTKLPIKGFIWYQGEENFYMDYSADPKFVYGEKFKTFIQSWRNAWKDNSLPFYFTELANYKWTNHGDKRIKSREDLPAFKCEQKKALSLQHVNAITISDVSDYNNIHPANKETVGNRLAFCALSEVYHKKYHPATTSFFLKMSKEKNGIRVWFTNKKGLHASNDKKLNWFWIAGTDNNFQNAETILNKKNGSVFVFNKNILSPTQIKFAWDEDAKPNLINASGMPASCFFEKLK